MDVKDKGSTNDDWLECWGFKSSFLRCSRGSSGDVKIQNIGFFLSFRKRNFFARNLWTFFVWIFLVYQSKLLINKTKEQGWPDIFAYGPNFIKYFQARLFLGITRLLSWTKSTLFLKNRMHCTATVSYTHLTLPTTPYV